MRGADVADPGSERIWEFFIDRGGTFTDCIARSPDGRLLSHKLLSSDSAPVDGIRRLLEGEGVIAPGGEIPAVSVRLGSTVATNALLERRGVASAFVTNRGLGDVPTIGTQQRPSLFELEIRLSPPLHREVIECRGRISARGEVVEELDLSELRGQLRAARERGIASLAISLIHAYAHPEFERRIAALALELDFTHVVCSHEIAREMGLLARGETALADAYLTPLLRNHVAELAERLPASRLRFMQSSGGLTDAGRFRGPNALLSGPAGGALAAARVAGRAGFERAIGFDMGGTSSDVSLIADGEVERAFETQVGGIRVRAPMLRIHTVAAGGGSLCRYDGYQLSVGPESAGSDPGPLCYGLTDERGVAKAGELALTDVNLALGRVQADRFPFELSSRRVEEALDALRGALRGDGIEMTRDELAAGFVEIANASMAQAIAQVSVARGADPRDHALVGFGGAGGQHVCGIARILGIRTILLHPLAGLLSAYGIGVARPSSDRQADAGRVLLEAGEVLPLCVEAIWLELEERARDELIREGIASEAVETRRWLDLRYRGTESALSIPEPDSHGESPQSWLEAFALEHRDRFGYDRPASAVEITTARVRVEAVSEASSSAAAREPTARGLAPPHCLRRASVYFPGRGRLEVPVYRREDLVAGTNLKGPALILEAAGTVVLEDEFGLEVDGEGVLRLHDQRERRVEEPSEAVAARRHSSDPIRLEVFANRFMSMAEQMGAVLRNTAFSTNIKERLDYSCAVFDVEGGLVANAPHIPVHLGAMGATVRAVRERFRELQDGDVIVTNDPFEGGSHLPDVTVVTPVFTGVGPRPDFFVASRGHHADLGGRTPGSMPPDSQRLDEEGVVIPPFKLVQSGLFDESGIRSLLSDARHPARRPDDNVADLVAMVAANRAGAALLAEFVAERGARMVATTMEELQRISAARVAEAIGQMPDGERVFEDAMDDGAPIRVCVGVRGERMSVDFSGSASAHRQNLNAPPAVVQAALLYVLRCLVSEALPLNGGCLAPVDLRIPPGSILDPPRGSAVVGGNVETSQRIVDVLLGALGRTAASQGSMNNVTFGNESFGYYETIGGGAGAGPDFDGASGVHTHMTNTRITDAEVLESRYPIRVERFSLRKDSGGRGLHRGGDGLVRCYRFLEPVTVSLLTERRSHAPWGLEGGEAGEPGRNTLILNDGRRVALKAKCSRSVQVGERLVIETPGGGGMGRGAGSDG